MVLVRGRNRVPKPAARMIARMRRLTELRDVWGKMGVQCLEFRILLKVVFHVSKRSRNVGEEFRVTFYTIDVYKSSNGFEVALDLTLSMRRIQ